MSCLYIDEDGEDVCEDMNLDCGECPWYDDTDDPDWDDDFDYIYEYDEEED